MSIPSGLLAAVPLFPLPDVVLFPRAVLPLHIFEERYKAMTADVLAGNRLIAVALLKPGWQKNYYQSPAIEPVVCVGEILSWEQLPIARQFRELLEGPIPTEAIADLAAFNLLEDIPVKQALLEDVDIPHRIAKIVEELRTVATHISPGLRGFPADPGSN